MAAGLVHFAARPLPSSPQAPYPSLPPKGESSLILLRLLSPRKASRLPRGPRFRSAGLRRGPQERGPGKRGRLALTGPFRPCVPGGFWVLFAGEKYLPEGPRPRKLHIAQRVLTKSAQSRNGLSGHSSRRSLARPLPSSPQAPYPSLPPKGESSLILLRLLSPRKASRLPRGPRFRFAGLRRGAREAGAFPLGEADIDTVRFWQTDFIPWRRNP